MNLIKSTVLILLCYASVNAADVDSKLLNNLTERKKVCKTAKYEIAGTVEIHLMDSPDPDDFVKFPKLPFKHPYTAKLWIDFEKSRYVMETTTEVFSSSDGKYMPEGGRAYFDGKALTFAPISHEMPKRGEVDVVRKRGNVPDACFGLELWQIFHAHGYCPTSCRQLTKKELLSSESDLGLVHKARVVLNGKSLDLYRSLPVPAQPVPSDELYFDNVSKSSVPQHDYFVGRNLGARTQSEWKVDPTLKMAMPIKWTVAWYSGTKLQSKAQYTVRSAIYDEPLDDAFFQYKFREGQLVDDLDYPEAGSGIDPLKLHTKRYVADRNGNLQLERETKASLLPGIEKPGRSSLLLQVVLIALTACLVVAIVLGLYHMSRKSKK